MLLDELEEIAASLQRLEKEDEGLLVSLGRTQSERKLKKAVGDIGIQRGRPIKRRQEIFTYINELRKKTSESNFSKDFKVKFIN